MAATVKAARRKMLTEVKTGMLDGGECILFQNDVNFTLNTLLADLTVATFTGYADVTLTTYPDPYTEPDGTASLDSPQCVFASSGSAVQNTVFGWAVKDAAGLLVGGGNFENPIAFNDVGDAVVFTVELSSDGSIRAVVV